ncbi:MAG TPA: serine hydrolase domain-containing protein [Acidimicrobiales bacterium]|nr:serine hydrolase domain-containing protein [Acidimicrobiales bacterium]
MSEAMSLSADRVESMLETAVAGIEVPGLSLAVFDDGTMIECATGRAELDPERHVRPEDLFPVWSVTKVMTAALVLILADRGLLDLRATVASTIPGVRIAGDAADRITIRQLLSHTAGLPPMGPPPTGIADAGAGDDCRELLVESLASARLAAQPGEVYSYSNPGYVVLAYVTERLTRTTWEAALCELLLDPAGIEAIDVPYHRPVDADRVALFRRDEAGQLFRVEEIYPAWRSGAPCGLTLWGTARALVDLGRIFFDGVAPNGRRILSEAALAAVLEPGASASSEPASGGAFQGLGWRGFDSRGHRILEKDGGRHNTLSVVPSKRLAVAVMTNGPGGDGLHDELTGQLVDAALGSG